MGGDWVRQHNADYLKLTLDEYDRFQVYANAKMSEWPVALLEYVKRTTGAVSGDTIFCKIAEWVRSGEPGKDNA